MVDWNAYNSKREAEADTGMGLGGMLWEPIKWATSDFPHGVVSGFWRVPYTDTYISPFRVTSEGYDPVLTGDEVTPQVRDTEKAYLAAGAPKGIAKVPKPLAIALTTIGTGGIGLATGMGKLGAGILAGIGGTAEAFHQGDRSLLGIGLGTAKLAVDPLMYLRAGKLGIQPMVAKLGGETLMAEKMTPKAFRMIQDIQKKSPYFKSLAEKDRNFGHIAAEMQLWGGVERRAGETLVKAAQREGLLAKGGIGFGTTAHIEAQIPGSTKLTEGLWKGKEYLKTTKVGAKAQSFFGKFKPEVENAKHVGLITGRESDEAGKAAISRWQTTMEKSKLPTEWIRTNATKAYSASRVLGRDKALKLFGGEALDVKQVDDLWQSLENEFSGVKKFFESKGLNSAELDLTQIESTIDDLVRQQEALGQKAMGGDKAARLAGKQMQDHIDALNRSKAQIGNYVTRSYHDDAIAFGRWLERNPDKYSEVMSRAEELFPGEIHYLSGDQFVTRRNHELARRLMANLVGHEPGRAAKAVPTAKIVKQRTLATEIMAENIYGAKPRTVKTGQFAPEGLPPKFVGTGVERSLVSHELEPLLDEMAKVMDMKEFSGWKGYKRSIKERFLGRKPDSDAVKLVPPKFFEDDPAMALVKSWESIGKPVSMTQAAKTLGESFGRKIAKGAAPNADEVLLAEIVGEEKAARMGIEGYAIPRTLEPDVRRYFRDMNSERSHNTFLEVFDGVQGWWKSQAILSPWFHSRNWIGGLWMSITNGSVRSPRSFVHALEIQAGLGRFKGYGRGGKLRKAAQKLASLTGRERGFSNGYITIPGTGEKIPYQKVVEMFKKEGGYGNAFWQFENVGTRTPLAQIAKGAGRPDKFLFDLNGKAMEAVEENLRLAQFIDGLKRGFSPRQAGKDVAYTHFLYEALSPQERSVARRIFPFYAFSRYNVPRQVYAALQKPRPFAMVNRSYQGLQNQEDAPPPHLQPQWIAQSVGVWVDYDKETKQDTYWSMGNYWPFADVMQLVDSPIDKMLNTALPVVKKGIALQYGVVPRVGGASEGQSGLRLQPIERVPGEQGQVGPFVMGKKQEEFWRTFRVVSDLDRLLGDIWGVVPKKTEGAKDRVSDMRTAVIATLAGMKPYVVDREQVARRKLYADESSIRKLRSAYMDAILSEDEPSISSYGERLDIINERRPTLRDIFDRKRRRQTSERSFARRMQRKGRLGAEYLTGRRE